jgi:predicted nucleotide-binding protein
METVLGSARETLARLQGAAVIEPSKPHSARRAEKNVASAISSLQLALELLATTEEQSFYSPFVRSGLDVFAHESHVAQTDWIIRAYSLIDLLALREGRLKHNKHWQDVAEVSRTIRTTPTMFIGSSVEGLPIARAIQAELEHDVESTIWSQGVFGLSGGTLDSLVVASRTFDFATLVLTPDDIVNKRGETRAAARDNVLFELGLFAGRLGPERVFIVRPEEEMDMPTDLVGITPARFRQRSDDNLQAALGPTGDRIRSAIEAARGTR